MNTKQFAEHFLDPYHAAASYILIFSWSSDSSDSSRPSSDTGARLETWDLPISLWIYTGIYAFLHIMQFSWGFSTNGTCSCRMGGSRCEREADSQVEKMIDSVSEWLFCAYQENLSWHFDIKNAEAVYNHVTRKQNSLGLQDCSRQRTCAWQHRLTETIVSEKKNHNKHVVCVDGGVDKPLGKQIIPQTANLIPQIEMNRGEQDITRRRYPLPGSSHQGPSYITFSIKIAADDKGIFIRLWPELYGNKQELKCIPEDGQEGIRSIWQQSADSAETAPLLSLVGSRGFLVAVRTDSLHLWRSESGGQICFLNIASESLPGTTYPHVLSSAQSVYHIHQKTRVLCILH
ncbi:hypothetical protein CAPTEDRAFT_201877 [Capitella teleta]|uniref:Uncharacterized protein n=1 Tax=Capitella teleta TaxID=283909 RepID=R7VKR7_CAPTE|nr:hypothetical protein CAPTEDRAFT_201877 [Capitella teleta]|eukprot:ELU16995.1 hypothetical protein CAPTEDRAFT_201877 [Capitella teleta]